MKILHFSRSSYFVVSAFFLTLFLIGYIWWPLVEEYFAYMDWQGPWWLYLDWLLIGIFLVMSILIMLGANIRQDIKIICVGLIGGLAIESWGTQTNLWTYYTLERPPLWIIPAWPIASLAIDRIVRLLQINLPKPWRGFYKWSFLGMLCLFFVMMLFFIAPTFDKPLTWASTLLVLMTILTTRDYRSSLIVFMAGSGLGYFLELWGTTRECWVYYTHQTPPVFAVFAHGMAALIFWRAIKILDLFVEQRVFNRIKVWSDDF